MRTITCVAAGAALAIMSAHAQAFDRDALDDFGWGARHSAHLSEYDGRPLGPPLSALPPGYQYYNGRLIRVPYHNPAFGVWVRPPVVTGSRRAYRGSSRR